jgi:small subunit ribosomal protein S4
MSKATMGRRSRFKIQRRLNVELPGLGKGGALEKRNYGPGQHGQKMRRKVSEYGIRLREKQKLLFHYGLRETQLRKWVKKAKITSHQREWVDMLASMLERRLDNVVFRLGFAPSMASARQLVSHRHVLVNEEKVDIPSYMLKKGDRVALTKKGYNSSSFLQARSNPRLDMPDFLGKVIESGQPVGILNEEPGVDNVPFEFEKRYFIEHYGRL